MSGHDFDKDIELAKLQSQIAGTQTWYYTTTGGLLAILFALMIVSFSVTLPNGLGYVVSGFELLAVLGMVYARWIARKNRAEFRKNFEDIYNRKRIDY